MVGLGGQINTTTLLQDEQKTIVHILSLVAATISVVTCIVSLYWFFLMRRNFRRT